MNVFDWVPFCFRTSDNWAMYILDYFSFLLSRFRWKHMYWIIFIWHTNCLPLELLVLLWSWWFYTFTRARNEMALISYLMLFVLMTDVYTLSQWAHGSKPVCNPWSFYWKHINFFVLYDDDDWWICSHYLMAQKELLISGLFMLCIY
jgi:hypothetical protein